MSPVTPPDVYRAGIYSFLSRRLHRAPDPSLPLWSCHSDPGSVAAGTEPTTLILALLLVLLVKMESPHLLSFLQKTCCLPRPMTLVIVFVRIGRSFLFIFCTQQREEWPGCLSPLWLLIKFIQLEVVIPGLNSSQPPQPLPCMHRRW